MTGLCSHVYHRACIMNWMQTGHDDCPNCRQPMWDAETYNMVDQGIKNTHVEDQHPKPSAPIGVDIECSDAVVHLSNFPLNAEEALLWQSTNQIGDQVFARRKHSLA